MSTMFATKNGRSGSESCGHCHNSGNVALDTPDVTDVGVPCPMCMVGFAVNQGRKETRDAFYWGGDDGKNPESFSWGHGLSVHDAYRCERRLQSGEPCGEPANRKRVCRSHRENTARAVDQIDASFARTVRFGVFAPTGTVVTMESKRGRAASTADPMATTSKREGLHG